MFHSISLSNVLNVMAKPVLCLHPFTNQWSFGLCCSTIIQIRSIASHGSGTVSFHLNKMNIFGNQPSFTVLECDSILNRILNVEQKSCFLTIVAVIDHDSSPLHRINILFPNQINDCVQQGMARTNQFCLGLPRNGSVALIKADSFITVQHRLAVTNCHISAPHGIGNRCNFISPGFSAAYSSA